jgi:hypothetical protein
VSLLTGLIKFFSRLFKRGSRKNGSHGNGQNGNGQNGNVSDDNYPMF